MIHVEICISNLVMSMASYARDSGKIVCTWLVPNHAFVRVVRWALARKNCRWPRFSAMTVLTATPWGRCCFGPLARSRATKAVAGCQSSALSFEELRQHCGTNPTSVRDDNLYPVRIPRQVS